MRDKVPKNRDLNKERENGVSWSHKGTNEEVTKPPLGLS